MTILTPEFEKAFEKYHIMSQKRNPNPLVLIKLKINDTIYYLLEYSKESKTAFWVEISARGWKCLYLNIPKLDKEVEDVSVDTTFLSTGLEECIISKL